MNTHAHAIADLPDDLRRSELQMAEPPRPMYWSVRRELWENRSLYVAPLAVAAVLLFGFLISTIGLPHRRRALLLLDEAQQRTAIERPYDMLAGMLMLTALLVAGFYCLDALYGERRDRSILFWKSLPVSDRTTVLSKAAIPVAIVPAITFVITVVAQMLMLMVSSSILLMSGLDPATVWRQATFVPSPLVLLYGWAAVTLWYAPLYAWLLLLSAWARRGPFLWAVLPPIVIAIFERITFNTSYFVKFIQYRVAGVMTQAFAVRQPAPARFLGTPGLWLGLIFAAAFLAAAVRLRRNREPI